MNRSPEKIFYEIKDNGLLFLPQPMCKYSNMKRSLRYCKFHEDFSDNTTDCFSLHEEIEALILSGHLKEFVTEMRQVRKSIEQDKSKQALGTSTECEAPQGSKKGV